MAYRRIEITLIEQNHLHGDLNELLDGRPIICQQELTSGEQTRWLSIDVREGVTEPILDALHESLGEMDDIHVAVLSGRRNLKKP